MSVHGGGVHIVHQDAQHDAAISAPSKRVRHQEDGRIRAEDVATERRECAPQPDILCDARRQTRPCHRQNTKTRTGRDERTRKCTPRYSLPPDCNLSMLTDLFPLESLREGQTAWDGGFGKPEPGGQRCATRDPCPQKEIKGQSAVRRAHGVPSAKRRAFTAGSGARDGMERGATPTLSRPS